MGPVHRKLRTGSAWTLPLLHLAALAALAAPAAAKQALPKVGGEIQINLTTTADQGAPSIAGNGAGSFAVAWQGPDERSQPHVYARVFSAAGEPRTAQIQVDLSSATGQPRIPRIGMDAAGNFAVAWSDAHIRVRRFDAQGQPLGAPFRADDTANFGIDAIDLAMAPDGTFVVVWLSATGAGAVYARRFSAEGAPLEASQRLDVTTMGINALPRVAASATGAFLLTWTRERHPDFVSRDDQVLLRRAAGGAPWSPEQQMNSGDNELVRWAVPTFHPDGGCSVVWQELKLLQSPFPTPRALVARRCDGDGFFDGPEKDLPFDPMTFEPPAVATDAFGNHLVVASYATTTRPQGRLFDPFWQPVGTAFDAATALDELQMSPTAAAAGEGFVAAWSTGSPFFPFLLPEPIPFSSLRVVAQRFGAPLCVKGSPVLCLGPDGRFELTAGWRTPAGATGVGRVASLAGDTGSFWFFGADNVELLVKVLDGRAVNGDFWVFSGAMSNVEYTLHVVDTETGAQRDYSNPQGQIASRADTAAFASGPGSPTQTIPDTISGLFTDDSVCQGHEQALCFQQGRIGIEVEFVDPRNGATFPAHPDGLTVGTGTFSFFDPGNVELAVKVIDGGPVNGFFWVFAAGMSNLDYTIKVTDRASGAVKTYHNVKGTLKSFADTRLFPRTSAR
jgi:hypothetical protein